MEDDAIMEADAIMFEVKQGREILFSFCCQQMADIKASEVNSALCQP